MKEFSEVSHGIPKSFDYRDKIVHCVNLFEAPVGSEHHRAQAVTLHSMSLARDFAKTLSPDLKVHLVSATVRADAGLSPKAFETHYFLERTVQDLASFKVPRALPLICDILNNVKLNKTDILIYTNVDIALMPGFYGFIEDVFSRGFDCAIINRRTISEGYDGPDQIARMYAELGAVHQGFDCFAFRAGLRDKMVPYNSCIGAANVMRPLVYNLLAFSDNPVVLLDAHETFHIGNDKAWKSDEYYDYSEFNRTEAYKVFDGILEDKEAKRRLITRLQGCHKRWVFSNEFRLRAGLERWPRDFDRPAPKANPALIKTESRSFRKRVQNKLGRVLGRLV